MSAARKSRNIVLACGVAAITAVGAYTGASLKTEVKKNEIKKEFIAEPVEQKIARLEAEKARWLHVRQDLVKKIDKLDAKMKGTGQNVKAA